MDERELAELRQVMIDMAPGLRADVNAMTHIMREMVDTERKKMGLDHPGGKLRLELNPERGNKANQPDLIGIGWVSGRAYQVSGWIRTESKLEITLSPRKEKPDGTQP